MNNLLPYAFARDFGVLARTDGDNGNPVEVWVSGATAPAAIAEVSSMAPKRNAGGEGGTAPAATTDPETGDEDPAGGSGSDTLTTVVASLGLAAGLLALGLVLLGRRQDRR